MEGVGGQSKILGWVIAGLVVVLAALTIIIVRSTAQPEPPDLTPVEVTPESTGPTAPGDAEPNADADSAGTGPTASAEGEGQTSGGEDRAGSADSSGPKEIEHSYEPVPNPPREVPDDDDDDADDDDDGDDDDADDDGDDDDD